MPKIKQEIEEDEEIVEESEDEDELEEEEELPVKRKPTANPLRKDMPKKQLDKIAVKRRFGIVAPQTIKIVDTETNEIVGDGEFLIAQALTDILERLERIENTIGTMNP
jgi:hypothetical protein